MKLVFAFLCLAAAVAAGKDLFFVCEHYQQK
jgi:hypothetical protein